MSKLRLLVLIILLTIAGIVIQAVINQRQKNRRFYEDRGNRETSWYF